MLVLWVLPTCHVGSTTGDRPTPRSPKVRHPGVARPQRRSAQARQTGSYGVCGAGVCFCCGDGGVAV